MAYGGPTGVSEDVEWIDAETGVEWDVLCNDDDGPQDTGGITVTLDGPVLKKKRVVRWPVTKEERLEAAEVHRCHTLCLMARAHMLDGAANHPELQAHVLSRLDSGLFWTDTHGSSVPRGAAALSGLLSWFRSNYAVTAVAELKDLYGQDVTSVLEQVLCAMRVQAGSAECLVALFVALLRAQGVLARVVRLCDPAPMRPWKLHQPVAAARPPRTAAAPPGHGLLGFSKLGRVAAGTTVASTGTTGFVGGSSSGVNAHEGKPAAAEASSSGGGKRGRAGGAGREQGGSSSTGGDGAVHAGNGAGNARAGSSGRGDRSRGGRGSKNGIGVGAGGASDTMLAGGSSSSGLANGRHVGANGVDRVTLSTAMSALDGAVDNVAAGAATAVPAAIAPAAVSNGDAADDGILGQAAADGNALGRSSKSRRNRGDEELELELQMAMLATQLESQAAETARQAAVLAAAKPPGASAAVRQQLLNRGGGRARNAPHKPPTIPWDALTLDAVSASPAGSAGAAAVAAGAVHSLRQGAVANCWAEVYVGDAGTGRWLHVDVVNGLVDKPESVVSGTARTTPAAYVVAAHDGGIKDVTSRYIFNMLTISDCRDEDWWRHTVASLHPPQAGGGSAAAATAIAHADVPAISTAGAPGGCSSTSHATANAVSGSGAATTAVGRAAGGMLVRPTALSVAATVNSTATAEAAAAAAAATLRQSREDNELRLHESVQFHEKPTTLEGWKKHPLYVLKRHIGKYQGLPPGCKLLGTHRGEAYYYRSQVSELHTAERWRLEGRQVRQAELATPARQVAKRKVTAAGGSGSGVEARRGGKGGARGEGGGQEDEEPEDEPGECDVGTASAGVLTDGAQVSLYGHWQTDEFARVAVDGVVPKNEHGNCEVPPFCKSLPLGTVHLDHQGIGGLARQLGVDYAPALIGFERQGGRMLPKLAGIVVCQEIQQRVMEAYWEREAARNAAAIEKQRKASRAAWLELLQAMRVRARLKSRYEGTEEGDMGQQEDAAGVGSRAKKSRAATAVDARREQLEADTARGVAAPCQDIDVEDF